MKFSVGDLVILKDGVIRSDRLPKVGIVLDSWPVEHAKHGYVYTIVNVQFGREPRELMEEDIELLNKLVK